MRFLQILAIAFVTGLSGAMMPGPLLVLVIGQTSVKGFMAVPAILLGHALLELIVLVLLMAGLRATLQRRRVRGVIGLIGGAALAWMGGDMIVHASQVTLDVAATGDVLGWGKLIIYGAAVCAANPYFVGWWATIGAGTLAHITPRSTGEYLTFYVAHELSDIVWYTVVGLLVILTAELLHQPAVYQMLVLGCGVILLVLAGWFLYTGLVFTLIRPPAPDETTKPATNLRA